MADYRLTEGGVVLYLDRITIPRDEKNRDWRRYQEWLAKGNEPDALLLPAVQERPEAIALAALDGAKDLDELKAVLSAYFEAKG